MFRSTLRSDSKMIPSNNTLFKANGHRHNKNCSNCYCMIAGEEKVSKIIQIITIPSRKCLLGQKNFYVHNKCIIKRTYRDDQRSVIAEETLKAI